MLNNEWDRFVIYVNAYYAVQEAYDSARREWERPAAGLEEFCKDANPFVWDAEGSAEPEVYEGFARGFGERFGKNVCTAADGLAYAHEWLAGLEGGRYGDALTESLHATANDEAWEEACEPIARQIAARRANIERTPQEDPALYLPEEPKTPSQQSIDAVIALLSKGDEAFAEQLRARLSSEDDDRA